MLTSLHQMSNFNPVSIVFYLFISVQCIKCTIKQIALKHLYTYLDFETRLYGKSRMNNATNNILFEPCHPPWPPGQRGVSQIILIG